MCGHTHIAGQCNTNPAVTRVVDYSVLLFRPPLCMLHCAVVFMHVSLLCVVPGSVKAGSLCSVPAVVCVACCLSVCSSVRMSVSEHACASSSCRGEAEELSSSSRSIKCNVYEPEGLRLAPSPYCVCVCVCDRWPSPQTEKSCLA